MSSRGTGSIPEQLKPLDSAPLDAGESLRQPIDLSRTAPFGLGGLQVDPLTRQLAYADGSAETLEPRVMEVLVALHRAGGTVLSRDDLTAACWRGNVVGEDAIQRAIQRLRKVAGLAESFRIDTITKAGYRLIVNEIPSEGARGDAPSLAVLPFTSRSGQAQDEGFALGMAEDLVDALSQGVNVRVIASSATAKFRARPLTDFPSTGRRLGVRYFLEGNVRRSGDMLRVTAQVVEAASSAIVWSQRFERHLDEFAQLQGDLVSEVAATLGATIFKLEMDRALRKPSNLTAWECIARAMAANREYGAEPLGRAIAESQHAMAIAPDYGLAQAIYALTISGAYFSISPPDPAREREIQQHIDRAFVLDPDDAGVLAAIAASSAYIGRPMEGLPRALRAIRLRPGHGLAHYAAGVNGLLQGKEPDAIVHLDDFLQVEPESHLHYITHAWRGVAYMRAHDFGAARGAFAESLALFPGNFIALMLLTCIEHCEGAGGAAQQHLATALELDAEATQELYQTRIGRFFAGSELHDAMHQALDATWVRVTALSRLPIEPLAGRPAAGSQSVCAKEVRMRYGHMALGAAALLACALPGQAQDTPKATPAAEAAHPDGHNHTDQVAPKTAQLLEGYGNGGFAIATSNPQAQAFFSNGMELAAAFAHKASVQAMEEAVRLDPQCAMCLWGLAYADGPTINYGVDLKDRPALYAKLTKAEKLAKKTESKRNRDLISVFRKRYRPGSTIEKRDRAFAKDMVKLTQRYPDDNTIAVLAADALIQAMGEDNYESEAMKASALLEVVLARAPNDTPAIHFYIHATEIAGVPARAEPYADKLGALAPRASHLVHMPSHTYYWVGRYQDAATVNHRAVELGKDNAIRLGMTEPDGVWGLPYHAHNVIFGLGGALMAGDAKIGLELGRPLVDRSQGQEKAHPVMQLLSAAGYFAIARFDDPKAVLARPEPKLPYLKAAWHYARGEVFAKQGDMAGLKAEIAALETFSAADSKVDSKAPDQMVQIVRLVLTGRLAMAEGRWADAQTAFKSAAEIEETPDFMRFSDPPAFWYPVRRDYAAALLAAGDKAGAKRELEATLKLRPKDPVAMAMLAGIAP